METTIATLISPKQSTCFSVCANNASTWKSSSYLMRSTVFCSGLLGFALIAPLKTFSGANFLLNNPRCTHAKIKSIVSPVAGRADIFVVPDLKAGNMLAKQLEYLAGAQMAGVVLGARVPIVLTSRADNAQASLLRDRPSVLRRQSAPRPAS